MVDRPAASSDQQVERMIGALLRAGLIAAAAVVLLGAVVYLVRHGGEQPDYRVFRGEPADLRSITGIAHQALEWRSTGLMQLGLLMLLATPIARVALSLVLFALQRDRLYVAVTLVVLGVLLYSVIGGYV
jgi:uncharacterized membrane protein